MKSANKSIRGIIVAIAALLFTQGSLQGRSLEWQKIDLEKDIVSQYEGAFVSVLKRDEFFVRAEVKYSDPGMPSFQDLNQDNFKVSDIPFDESKGDYIAFSKVGLEVPVLGKAYQEHQSKLKEMYRYNESYDLFKNIQSIDVVINVSDAISAEKLELVESVKENFKITVGGFIPKVSVNKIKMEEVKDIKAKRALAGKEKDPGLKEFLELLGKFGNAIGMILTVLILGALSFMLLKKYMEFMEKLKSMESPAAKEQKPEEDEKDPNASGVNGAQTPEQDTFNDGFERFEKLVKLNPRQATLLVKRWIREKSQESALALGAVAQQLEAELLDSIFSGLDAMEREEWTDSIEGYLEGKALERANKIVSEGVVKELIGASFIDDFELVDIILGMDSEMVKDYILGNRQYGKILANLVNSEIISQVFNELDEDEIDQMVAMSLDFSVQDAIDNLEGFKESLRGFCARGAAKPFNNKLLQVVSDVSPEKEAILYRFMAKDTKRSQIVAAAMRNLPSELVFKLPSAFLKETMQNYPMSKKIGLLVSLTEEKREFLLNSFTEEGSNAREMILMELETLESDELQKKRVEANRDELWTQFVKYVRGAIKNKEGLEHEVRGIVEEWADALKSGEVKIAA